MSIFKSISTDISQYSLSIIQFQINKQFQYSVLVVYLKLNIDIGDDVER